MKILYIATNFTAVTHTFITREVDQLRRAGTTVDLLSVRTHTEQAGAANPECDLTGTMRIYPVTAWQILGGLVSALLARPGRLLATVGMILGSREDSLKTRFKLLYQLAVATSHRRAIADREYDWIHAHFASSPTTFALFLHELTGVPYSFTGHAADIFRESSLLKAKLKHAAGVVAISGYNHDHYNTIVPGLATERVHCGIEPETFVFQHRTTPNSPLRILAVGRSVPKKGFADLLDALHLLSGAGIAWTGDIAGGGPLEAELQAQADRLGLADLTLHGSLQQERIRELIDAADVFVLPCVVTEDGDRDNIPVSLMEAMAAGCPVISTDVAGIPELIGTDDEFGIIVAQHDPSAIAAALTNLTTDHRRLAELSLAGRSRVETEFNVRTSADKLLQFFSGGS